MLILIVDDHPLVCSALEATLRSVFQDCDVRQAHSAAEATAAIENNAEFDLVLLDLKLPDVDGLDGLKRLRAAAPRLPILVLSGLDDCRLAQLVRSHGALGFLNKKASPHEITGAVQAVLDGHAVFATTFEDARAADDEADQIAQAMNSLTPQQRTVLRMLGEGLLNKQIAYELSISESTVKGHVSAILRKFSVPSRMQAVLLAQRGLFDQALGPMTGSRAASASR